MLWRLQKRSSETTRPRRPRRLAWLLAWLLLGPAALGARGEESDETSAGPDWRSRLRGDVPAFVLPSPIGDIEYRAGRGLRVGDTGLNIGGFTTLEFDRGEDGDREIELDSVSFLLLWEPIPQFRAFVELDVDNLYTDGRQGGVFEYASDPQVTLERAYAELRLRDALKLRIGKFQTPIGRWNLVPAEPFVWTASSPVIVEEGFDTHQTGGALLGSLHRERGSLHYWLYGQVTEPIDPSDDPPHADHGVGGRLQWDATSGSWSLGASYLAAETNDRWSHLAGLDAEAGLGPLLLTSELTLVRGDALVRDLWGAYLQAVLDVGCGFHLVARYEYFDPVADDDVSLLDAGVAWTPLPWLRIKADYRTSTRQTDAVTRGVSTSFSIVF